MCSESKWSQFQRPRPGERPSGKPSFAKNTSGSEQMFFFNNPFWNETERTLCGMKSDVVFALRLWDRKRKVAIPLCGVSLVVKWPLWDEIGLCKKKKNRLKKESFSTCLHCFQSTQNQHSGPWNIVLLQTLCFAEVFQKEVLRTMCHVSPQRQVESAGLPACLVDVPCS